MPDRPLPPATGTVRTHVAWWRRILRFLGILGAIALPGCAGAKWTAGDTFTESAVALTIAGDFLQTRHICQIQAATPDDWREESNPIMGAECERVPPEIYFPVAMAAHVGAARLMPKPIRRLFQLATIVTQMRMIDRNLQAGLKISW